MILLYAAVHKTLEGVELLLPDIDDETDNDFNNCSNFYKQALFIIEL